MIKIILFLGLFVAFMVYRMVVVYRNQDSGMSKKVHKVDDDENIINDPGLFWHPLNNHND